MYLRSNRIWILFNTLDMCWICFIMQWRGRIVYLHWTKYSVIQNFYYNNILSLCPIYIYRSLFLVCMCMTEFYQEHDLCPGIALLYPVSVQFGGISNSYKPPFIKRLSAVFPLIFQQFAWQTWHLNDTQECI